jgi:hypothetical protein
LRENRDSAKLAALQKSQEVESLSGEVARLIRQSFAKGNEIADLKEQSNEREAEIERLNEVIACFWYFSLLLTGFTAPRNLKKRLKLQGMGMKAVGDVFVTDNSPTATFARSK